MLNPCQNGGSCTGSTIGQVAGVTAASGLRCDCPPEYSGTTCGNDVCTPNPCKNRGTCVIDEIRNAKCTCETGFYGKLCGK